MGYSDEQIGVFNELFEALVALNEGNITEGNFPQPQISTRVSSNQKQLQTENAKPDNDSACQQIVRQAYQDAQVVLGKAQERLGDGFDGDKQVLDLKGALEEAQAIIPVYPKEYLAAYEAVNTLFDVKHPSKEGGAEEEVQSQKTSLTEGLAKLQHIDNPMSASELTQMIGAFRQLATAVMQGGTSELTGFDAAIDAMGPLNIAYKAQNPALFDDAGLEEGDEEAPDDEAEVVEAPPPHSPEKIVAQRTELGLNKEAPVTEGTISPPPLQRNLGTIIFLAAMVSTGLLFPVIAPAAMAAMLGVIGVTASALALPALIGISVGMFALGGLILTGLDRAFNLTNRMPGLSALRKPSITITLMSAGFVTALAVTLLVAPVMPVVMAALAGGLAAVGLAGVVTISALPVFAIPLAVAGVAALAVGALIGVVKLLGMMGSASPKVGGELGAGESKTKGGVGEPSVPDAERDSVVDPDAQPESRRGSEIGKDKNQSSEGKDLAGEPPEVPPFPGIAPSSPSRLRSGSLADVKCAGVEPRSDKPVARSRASSAPVKVQAREPDSGLGISSGNTPLALNAASLQQPSSSSPVLGSLTPEPDPDTPEIQGANGSGMNRTGGGT